MVIGRILLIPRQTNITCILIILFCDLNEQKNQKIVRFEPKTFSTTFKRNVTRTLPFILFTYSSPKFSSHRATSVRTRRLTSTSKSCLNFKRDAFGGDRRRMQQMLTRKCTHLSPKNWAASFLRRARLVTEESLDGL